jgi:hypothetical protein
MTGSHSLLNRLLGPTYTPDNVFEEHALHIRPLLNGGSPNGERAPSFGTSRLVPTDALED